ncbi:MAG: hypothetical protein JRG73_05140 [Deltaproteobacteria bacterium]|nr:hypothetical protein [Deltaproteobacteria bacterium]
MEGAARGENSKFIREKLPEMKSLWTAKGAGHFAWRFFMCAGLQYCPVNIIQARDSRAASFLPTLPAYLLLIYLQGRPVTFSFTRDGDIPAKSGSAV